MFTRRRKQIASLCEKTTSNIFQGCTDSASTFGFEPSYDCENDKSYFQPEWFSVVNYDAKMFCYLKDFQQGFHVKPPDAEGNSEDSRHNNEHQQEGEPHCKRDSQQDAQQVVERVEEELHLKVRWEQTSLNSLKSEGRRLHYISWPKMALHEDHNRGRVLLKLNLKQMAKLASSSWSRSWIAISYGLIKIPTNWGEMAGPCCRCPLLSQHNLLLVQVM